MPRTAAPVIVGGELLVGGAPVTAPLAADVAEADPSGSVAVTTARSSVLSSTVLSV